MGSSGGSASGGSAVVEEGVASESAPPPGEIGAEENRRVMTRAEILDTAKEYVTKDRQNSYGEPEYSFGLIAAFWSNYLRVPVSSTDVAMLMTLLKIARQRENPQHLDSYIDGAGYLACGGEIAGGTA